MESLAITERHGLVTSYPTDPCIGTSRLGQVELVKGARVPAWTSSVITHVELEVLDVLRMVKMC